MNHRDTPVRRLSSPELSGPVGGSWCGIFANVGVIFAMHLRVNVGKYSTVVWDGQLKRMSW